MQRKTHSFNLLVQADSSLPLLHYDDLLGLLEVLSACTCLLAVPICCKKGEPHLGSIGTAPLMFCLIAVILDATAYQRPPCTCCLLTLAGHLGC